jgi:Fungal N-terminal domain of STAND proteins
MADPFSIIGLVMTTLKTINSAKNFVDTTRRAPRSIETLSNELSEIEALLRQLGHITNGERADEQEMHQLLGPPMARCEKISKQVEKLIQPYIKTSGGVTVWGRFAFGFKESDVRLLHRDMGDCKQNLSLVITSANL